MRALILTVALGLVGLGFASPADAHPPGRGARPHDVAPHWHRTDTFFGPVYWYGNGVHDYLPHAHGYSPWTGRQSYSITPFGPTTSYHGSPYSSYYGSSGYYGNGYYGNGYYGNGGYYSNGGYGYGTYYAPSYGGSYSYRIR